MVSGLIFRNSVYSCFDICNKFQLLSVNLAKIVIGMFLSQCRNQARIYIKGWRFLVPVGCCE